MEEDVVRYVAVHACPLKWSADAAVFAHPPEVNRQEQRSRQRDGDTMEDVKAVERFFADETRAEQAKARVGGVGNHVDAVDRQELVAGAFITQKRRGPSHVRADRDGPNRKLVPGQQVSCERQEQREQE